MAVQNVQFMGPNDKQTTVQGKQGSGKFGQAAGALLGGVAGGAAGGPGGAIAGASTGASLGGMAGNALDPAVADKTAIQRRIQSSGPQYQQSENTMKLKDSVLALRTQPPEIQQQYAPPLVQAYVTSLAHDNPKNGGMA